MNELADFIAKVGFPAVMCLLFFKLSWSLTKVVRDNTEAVNRITEAMNYNTRALRELCRQVENKSKIP